LDEKNNLYVLDVNFGGVLDENVERVLKYSEKGVYLGEVYSYRYPNEDFILTKGKISGMAYHDGVVYVIRLEREGFWLDRRLVEGGEEPEGVYVEYPNAFRDLVYCHINAGNRRLTFTTKAGGIRQYDFNGNLSYERAAARGEQKLPWTAVSDDGNNIIYTDILTKEIIRIGGEDTEALYKAGEGESLYYRVNHAWGKLLAASYENIYIGDEGSYEIINSYTYGSGTVRMRTVVFIFGILDICVLLGVAVLFIIILPKKKINPSLRTILVTGACIASGAIIASIFIINRMNEQYNQKTFNDLENISQLITSEIDPGILTSISSPADYDTLDYLRFKESLTALFSKLQFQGERVYQIIWAIDNDYIYSLYDLESSTGTYYPFSTYTDGPYKEAYDTKGYVHAAGEVTSEGSWLFVCGPIFDREGNVVALIETGYNMRSVQEQTWAAIVQTSLIVLAATAAILIIIEFILIFAAYRKNKTELKIREEMKTGAPNAGPLQILIAMVIEAHRKRFEQYIDKPFPSERLKTIVPFLFESYKKKTEQAARPPFHPELLRALIFFLFLVNNLEAALLPMYAVNLYEPIFSLPKSFVVTLPIIADMASAALALVIIPAVLERTGLKRISIIAVIFVFIGNVLCFIAENTAYLAVAHVFTGFAGGSLLLVINTIIGGQTDIKDINSGFAHFNASYLAGVNVGVVLGSTLAQFFAYRTVYLFSSMFALILLGIAIFSVRSNTVNYIYDVQIQRDRRKGTLVKFILNPVVIACLILLVLSYDMSLSFTSYFMPIYGIENGLRESNIGQLILLNGLFAILFGTSLCEYVSNKVPIKVIIILSLVLNAGAIYLFSINMSISMLIIVIIILAIVNIFALTNIQTYYALLYQNTRVSSSKALGVYSTVENMSMAIGPVVFSYIVSSNITWGLRLFSVILLASLFLFILIAGIFKEKKR
jgi:predicted MFS family arabinose efflux permease